MTPVILSRQQLDQLWEIDRSEIIDTLYRLDNGQLRAYREILMTCVAGTLTIVRLILRFTRPVTIAAVFFSPFLTMSR